MTLMNGVTIIGNIDMTNKDANDSIRKQEKHIISMLEQSKKFFNGWVDDCNMALDYYRLKDGGTYSDEELDHIWKDSKGTEHNMMKPIPTIKQSKQYMYEKTRSTMLDTLGYMYHDFFEARREDILPMDKEELKQFLEKNEVDTY